MSKITLGIDIAKAKFDAAILFENNKVKTKQFENKPSGFTQMIEWLKQHDALGVHACLEATGHFIFKNILLLYRHLQHLLSSCEF